MSTSSYYSRKYAMPEYEYEYDPWTHTHVAYPRTYKPSYTYDVPSVRTVYGRPYRSSSDYGYRSPYGYNTMLYNGYGKRYADWAPPADDRYVYYYPRYSRYSSWY